MVGISSILKISNFPVVTDNGNHIPGNFTAERGRFTFGHIHNFAAVAGLGYQVIFINDKTLAGIRCNDIGSLRFKDKHFTDIVIDAQINHQTQRLAETAAAWNFIARDVEEFSRSVKENDFVRRLGMNGTLQRVVIFKFEIVIQIDMTFDAAYPAFFGTK
mgnify:CR=1 FL=1